MGRYDGQTAAELEELRVLTMARLGQVPAFRRGSVQVGYRRCGKPGCWCAAPGVQGHGPRVQWTRTAPGRGGSRAQVIPADQVERVRREVAAGRVFTEIVADLVEIDEAVCRARVVPSRSRPGPRPAGEKGGPAPPAAKTSTTR